MKTIIKSALLSAAILGSSAAALIFSYYPWMLLSMLILPALYVIPYMTQGLCIGSRWMTQAAYERQE